MRLAGLCLALALGPSGARADDALQLRASFGIGAHSRSFVRPTDSGAQTLSTSPVPAVEVGFAVLVGPEADTTLQIGLSYQTGLWLTVSELPAFALANEVSVRSQRLALSIAPSWRVASGTHLGFALGGTLRAFWPEDRALQTPSYSLVGPHARAELQTALIGPLRARVVPELQWLVLIDEHAPYSTQGAAVGGELVLELAWTPRRVLALSYRESRALLARGAAFRDTERYLTLRIEEVF